MLRQIRPVGMSTGAPTVRQGPDEVVAMSAVTAVAARALATPSAARDLQPRRLRLTRTQRLRLFLVAAAGLVAVVLPLALAASDALRSLGIHAAVTPPTVALVVVLGLAAPVASLWVSTLKVLGIGAVAAAALTLLAEGNVDQSTMLSLAYPALALGLSVVGTLFAKHVLHEFEHEVQRMQCTRFVPEQVAERMLSADVRVGLGGIEVAGTVVFVDLRSFTSYAESRPAAEVIRVLNTYLSELSCAMLEHGGTTISYLGDGLLAVFGAPLEQEDHADRALAAAREILEERLPRANAWMRDEGLGEGFRLGIGVNSGAFLAGNVGNERRLEYTAIGDSVNTAARIQELTKSAGCMLLIDRSTCHSLCAGADDLVCMGQFDVRGRQGKVELWSLSCDIGLPPTPVSAAVTSS
jgi:adenylate cyclase